MLTTVSHRAFQGPDRQVFEGSATSRCGGSIKDSKSRVEGHRPALALVVEIDEVFGHCAKALMRSQLWHPPTWDPMAVGSRPQIVKALERPEDTIEELEEYYGEEYSTGHY